MRYFALASLVLAMGFLCGCRVNQSLVMDCERYDSGELKSIAAVSVYEKHRNYSYKTEYFKNGRLKLEQWAAASGLLMRLEFHENGMLKSEERYLNNQIRYGATYGPEGQLEKTQGQKIKSEAQCRMVK